MNELLNELHDSGVIKLKGGEDLTFDTSILEIKENKENNNGEREKLFAECYCYNWWALSYLILVQRLCWSSRPAVAR